MVAFKEPSSMDELVYFTNRFLENNGYAKAWTYKKQCPKCKTLMNKPSEKGKVKIRAKYYVCPKCGYEEDKAVVDKDLFVEIKYKCPCGHEGYVKMPYVRKKYQGVDAFVFNCEKCNRTIAVTKKMKALKAKKKSSDVDDDGDDE